ncbi:7-alpha-hydroxycholest-4-en-3-one 12-alpha-hydroxylase [Diplogelasinospora grovesii]|uniref:7-alpha-hydroxycholest-4-en-3-one 12-alpha-hydroxylase n=1 Tax=Diplogelasinospora grovesii TaxID=303347 RepID=A0AAN6N4V2_9PEZI|nr:7-alpha-hydroxycholest-4-en-3-one 12-alpha-hydroxylase [Diplogelasinospora grovesii]
MELTFLASAVLATVIAVLCLDWIVGRFRHAAAGGEPIHIRPGIPLIGHLLGILRSGPEYFSRIDAKHPSAGIFSLPLLPFSKFKFYVITDRALITPVHRAARTISFTPFIKQANKGFARLGPESLAVHDDPSFSHDFKSISAQGMAPGTADLDGLNLVTAQEELRVVDELASRSQDGPVSLDLTAWVQHVISQSATRGLYGPENPYKDPEHEKGFWAFHSGLQEILINLFPGILAAKAVKGQAENGRRYEEYLFRGGHKTASRAIRERTSFFERHGFSQRENAWMNVGGDIAILSNFVPTAFWTVFNIISRDDLLGSIREEVSKAVTRDEIEGTCTLDLSILRTGCPLLLSAFQETQRLHTVHAMIREVVRDTTITSTEEEGKSYLLKQGNYVQVASMPTLRTPQIWGGRPMEFDPCRFIKLKKDPEAAGVKPADLPPAAFPVWGMAPHLCPARFYASTGCLTLAALVVLRLDVEPADTDRRWKKPKADMKFVSIERPVEEVPVRVSLREGWNDGLWRVVVGAPGTPSPRRRRPDHALRRHQRRRHLRANVTVPASAISSDTFNQGFSAFEIDSGSLCTQLGGCPPSAKLITTNITCDLSDSLGVLGGCGALGNTGHLIEIDSTNGFVNFKGPLDDNLRCVQCTVDTPSSGGLVGGPDGGS